MAERVQWEYGQFLASVSGSTMERSVGAINGQMLGSSEEAIDPFVLLNQMGDEGWELVSIHALMPPSPNAAMPFGLFEYVLKRPRSGI
jgi:hypothetical protein